MIEELCINKILSNRSTAILEEQGLTKEHFLVCKEEIEYILEHQELYGNVPDIPTFLERFKDFEIVEVVESDEYLAYRLKEAKLYTDSVPVLKKVEELIREDSIKAIEYLKRETERLLNQERFNANIGYDIIANAEDRLADYKRRVEVEGLLGISTGIPLLDEITHGWLPEDLVVLYARTNMGKSWLLLYFLTQAWRAGHKVALYSGEMSKEIVGFRFDTLNEHFSNTSLMHGLTELGDVRYEEVGSRTVEDYERYINNLKKKDGFIVVTREDFGGRKPTVSDLKRVAKETGAEIFGVDQLSLMTDEKNGSSIKDKYTNIAEGLFLMSCDLQIPILLAAQANRDAVKGKDKGEIPELYNIKDSSGVEENATRALGFVVIDNIMKIGVRKNRYDQNNKDVLMVWNPNLGLLKPLLEGGEAEQDEYGF